MNCTICLNSEAKYRCPTCRVRYCSVKCWKKHKDVMCKTDVKENKKENDKQYKYITEDTVPVDSLKLLEKNENLLKVLQNPHLRDMLTAVDSSAQPEKAIQTAMLEPMFVEFVDECLKIIEPSPDSPQSYDVSDVIHALQENVT